MDLSGNSAASVESAARLVREADNVLVYVHFPWCLKKCPYCDFASYPAAVDRIEHAKYADAVLAELELRSSTIPPNARLRSVFFGGGTPSLWDPTQLGRAVRGIVAAFAQREPDVEITVECNPTSFDERRGEALLAAGVNRVSMGVQSLDRDRLAFLGRLHDPDGALEALRAAQRSGFTRVSGDLMFGVQGGRPQSPEDAASDVERVADTGVRHVSAYGLTIEPATQFGELHRKGRLPVATDDVVVESFFAIEETLAKRGFRHYEISNYAVPGEESRHNVGYWLGLDYLGLGCAAVGALSTGLGGARRYRNHPDPGRYVRGALAGSLAVAEEEVLDPETRLRERIMLGIRLESGFDLVEAAQDLGIDPLTRERRASLERLRAAGKIALHGSRVTVAPMARALTDGIAAELF